MFFDGNMAAIIGYLDPAAADRRAGRGDVRVKMFWFILFREYPGFSAGIGMNPLISRSRAQATSFRDPSGFVFNSDEEVFRQVNRGYQGNYDYLVASGL